CTNPNSTSYFGLATVASHKVLCTPAGHPYFGRGFFVMDDTSNGNDESGMNYAQYVTTKYGNETAWAIQELTRMQSWGFNMTGPFSAAYVVPWQTPAAPKVPYIFNEEPCSEALTNRFGWSTAPTKDLMGASSQFWNMTNAFPSVTDYEDPAWVTYVQTALSAAGDYGYMQTMAASATDKSYFIGVTMCDSDDTHGMNGGPDFRTSPTVGNNDFRLSMMVALMSPIQWATSRQGGVIYTDSTVYSKKALYTQLTGEYGTIAALNTAWGSSYTTFGTSGTCHGSHFATWICPSPGAAISVGTGNGATTTFSATLSGTVSANSLGIFSAGDLVGGDGGNGHFSTAGTLTGAGAISGTINYSTGALSVTFATAPASGAAITAEYIQNGWGVGTGAMDEDGRSAHSAYIGSNVVCIDGVGDSSVCTGGYSSAGFTADMGTLDTTLAARYAKTFYDQIQATLPGALNIGLDTCGTWGTPPNRYVLAGIAPYVSACMLPATTSITQAMVDFVHTYAGDMALGMGIYNSANCDSIFDFPVSSCTRSGTTVTCTVSTPNQFSTSIPIQTSCTDSTYNISGLDPNSASGATVVYTASVTPTNPTTTCNVAQASPSQDFATQALRGAAFESTVETLQNTKYTADGVYPFTFALWWQWFDPQRENQNLGIVDTRVNSYDGLETVTSTVACQAPLASFSCGGELRTGWGSDSVLESVIPANAALDSYLAGL